VAGDFAFEGSEEGAGFAAFDDERTLKETEAGKEPVDERPPLAGEAEFLEADQFAFLDAVDLGEGDADEGAAEVKGCFEVEETAVEGDVAFEVEPEQAGAGEGVEVGETAVVGGDDGLGDGARFAIDLVAGFGWSQEAVDFEEQGADCLGRVDEMVEGEGDVLHAREVGGFGGEGGVVRVGGGERGARTGLSAGDGFGFGPGQGAEQHGDAGHDGVAESACLQGGGDGSFA
jgi:hypothetical protein